MDFEEITGLIFIVLWIVLLFLLHRGKMGFLKFVVGIVGGFIFTLHFGKVFLEEIVTLMNLNILASVTHGISNIQVYIAENAVTIFTGNDVLSYFITYECSSLIEMLAFTNILLFYPIHVGRFMKKMSILIIGLIYILLTNVIRLLLMSGIVIVFGVNSYFIAHVIVARLVFIGFNIMLYYFVFTLPHIKEQHVSDYTVGREISLKE